MAGLKQGSQILSIGAIHLCSKWKICHGIQNSIRMHHISEMDKTESTEILRNYTVFFFNPRTLRLHFTYSQ